VDLRTLKAERYRRLSTIDRIRTDLFDKQLAVIDDKSKRKAVLTSRRAGKTHMLGALNVLGAMASPRLTAPYIALTRGHAKRLVWPVLHDLNRKYDLRMQMHEVDLRATLPNGASIWLVGADDSREVEKLRGNAYARVSIDEAASFGVRIKYLIKDVLRAALLDYDGELILAGTPGAACVGEFHDATTAADSRWSVHRWGITDNSRFPRWHGKANWRDIAAQALRDAMTEEGWDYDNPTYQREWLGNWVRDDSSLVYHYDPKHDAVQPADDLQCVMGVDLGHDDAFSIEVVGWSEYSPGAWELAAFKQSGLTVTDMAAMVREYKAQWSPRSIVADTGGLGKAIVEEFNKRHGLNVRPAEKAHKQEYIRMLNDDLRSGRVHIIPGGGLAQEWTVLQWAQGDGRRIEDPRYDNHAADAFLYAWRESGHYRHAPGVKRPPPKGSAAAIELEAQAMFDEPEQDDDGVPAWMK
jgi:hypothetical protein